MMSDERFKLPQMMEILSPRQVSLRRDPDAKKKGADPMRHIRINDNMWAMFDEAAAIIGMSRSELVRWTTHQVANQIIGGYTRCQREQKKLGLQQRMEDAKKVEAPVSLPSAEDIKKLFTQ